MAGARNGDRYHHHTQPENELLEKGFSSVIHIIRMQYTSVSDLNYRHTLFCSCSQILRFYNWKVYGNPVSSKPIFLKAQMMASIF